MRPVSDIAWIRAARDEALIRQKGRCAYCKRPLKRAHATADHIKPKSHRGLDSKDNIAAACAPCNLAKGSIPIAKFKKMIKGKAPPAYYGIAVQAMFRRIEKRTQRAVANILASAR